MKGIYYRCFLIFTFLTIGSVTAWLFDESHILQGVSDVSEAKEILNKEHLEMAIAGLIAGGLSILAIDEIKKKIDKRQSKSQDA